MIVDGHKILLIDIHTISIDNIRYWASWLIEGDDPKDTTKLLTLISSDSLSVQGSLRGASILTITPSLLGLIEKHISVFDDPFCHETNRHGITMVTLPCPYKEEP